MCVGRDFMFKKISFKLLCSVALIIVFLTGPMVAAIKQFPSQLSSSQLAIAGQEVILKGDLELLQAYLDGFGEVIFPGFDACVRENDCCDRTFLLEKKLLPSTERNSSFRAESPAIVAGQPVLVDWDRCMGQGGLSRLDQSTSQEMNDLEQALVRKRSRSQLSNNLSNHRISSLQSVSDYSGFPVYITDREDSSFTISLIIKDIDGDLVKQWEMSSHQVFPLKNSEFGISYGVFFDLLQCMLHENIYFINRVISFNQSDSSTARFVSSNPLTVNKLSDSLERMHHRAESDFGWIGYDDVLSGTRKYFFGIPYRDSSVIFEVEVCQKEVIGINLRKIEEVARFLVQNRSLYYYLRGGGNLCPILVAQYERARQEQLQSSRDRANLRTQ